MTFMISKALSAVVALGMVAGIAPSAAARTTPASSLAGSIAKIVRQDVKAVNLPTSRGGTNGYYDKPIHEVGTVHCVQIAPLSKWANFACTFTIADFDGSISVTYHYKFHVDASNPLGGWAPVSLPFAPFAIW